MPSARINLIRIALMQGYSLNDASKLADQIVTKCQKKGVVLTWEGSKSVADKMCANS
jgi:hypothetical protein